MILIQAEPVRLLDRLISPLSTVSFTKVHIKIWEGGVSLLVHHDYKSTYTVVLRMEDDFFSFFKSDQTVYSSAEICELYSLLRTTAIINLPKLTIHFEKAQEQHQEQASSSRSPGKITSISKRLNNLENRHQTGQTLLIPFVDQNAGGSSSKGKKRNDRRNQVTHRPIDHLLFRFVGAENKPMASIRIPLHTPEKPDQDHGDHILMNVFSMDAKEFNKMAHQASEHPACVTLTKSQAKFSFGTNETILTREQYTIHEEGEDDTFETKFNFCLTPMHFFDALSEMTERVYLMKTKDLQTVISYVFGRPSIRYYVYFPFD